MIANMRFETHGGNPAVIFSFDNAACLAALKNTKVFVSIRKDMQNFSYASNTGWENSETWMESCLLTADGQVREIRVDGEVAGLLSSGLELQVSVKVDGMLVLDKIPCAASARNEPQPPIKLNKLAIAGLLMVMIAGSVWINHILSSKPEPLPKTTPQTDPELEQARQEMARIRREASETREQIDRQNRELLRQQQATAQMLQEAQEQKRQAELALLRQREETAQSATGREVAESDLRQFIEAYLSAINSGEVTRLLSLYAGRVDYFAKGTVGKDFIKQDKEYYFKRWPKQVNELDRLVSIAHEGSVYILEFDINFQVYSFSRGEKIVGKAKTILSVIVNDGRLEIIGEKQVVSEKYKEPLP